MIGSILTVLIFVAFFIIILFTFHKFGWKYFYNLLKDKRIVFSTIIDVASLFLIGLIWILILKYVLSLNVNKPDFLSSLIGMKSLVIYSLWSYFFFIILVHVISKLFVYRIYYNKWIKWKNLLIDYLINLITIFFIAFVLFVFATVISSLIATQEITKVIVALLFVFFSIIVIFYVLFFVMFVEIYYFKNPKFRTLLFASKKALRDGLKYYNFWFVLTSFFLIFSIISMLSPYKDLNMVSFIIFILIMYLI